jgi:glycosyltransferase involved in cell wall biosynthesis
VRIAVSLLAFRPGRVGGAETYVRKLVEYLPRHAGSDELVAVMNEPVARSLATSGFDRAVVPRSDVTLAAERILEALTPYAARAISLAVVETGADVVLFPQQSVFPLDVPVRAVVTVHDLQHLVSPENFGAFDTVFRARVYPRSLERAAAIVAISELTRRDLVERCGADSRRITVVPHGVDAAHDDAVQPWDAGFPYFYFPAATHAHKGHDVLLHAFAALRRRGWGRHRLVLTGEKTANWAKLERLVRELRLEQAVIHRGFVSPPEVARVYAGADAVLFPTRFEGFGLPVLEAVQLRKKVIVSRLAIFDELGVPRRWQIDFADPEQLAAALAQEAPTTLEKQPCTWSEVARRTLDVLRDAAAAPRAGAAW